MEELLGVWKEFRKDVTEAEAGRVGWGRILEGLAHQVKRPGQPWLQLITWFLLSLL